MPTEQDTELDEAEMRRILALASALKKKQGGKATLRDLEQSAGDVGLSAEEVREAFRRLKHERQRRRALLLLGLFLALGLWGVTAFVGWWTRPVRFDGESTVRFSTLVKDSAPVDSIKSVKLLSRREFYVFVRLIGLKHNHRMRCDLVDQNGARHYRGLVQLENAGENHTVWFNVQLPWTTPLGDYEAQIFADDQLVNEESIRIEAGRSVAAATRASDSKVHVAAFSRAKDQKAYGRIDFDDLRGEKVPVEFAWRDGSGKEFRHNAIVLQKPEGAHYAWDVLDLGAAPDGEVVFSATLEGIPLGEAKTTIAP